MSWTPKLKAPMSRCGCSAWTSAASGVDSSDDEEDSGACRLGVVGAMESAAISTTGISGKPGNSGTQCAVGDERAAPTVPAGTGTSWTPSGRSSSCSGSTSSDSCSGTTSRWPSATLHHSMSAKTLLVLVSEPEERRCPLPPWVRVPAPDRGLGWAGYGDGRTEGDESERRREGIPNEESRTA